MRRLFWLIRNVLCALSIIFIFFTLLIFYLIPVMLLRLPENYRYLFAKYFSYGFIYSMWFICGIKYEIEGEEKLEGLDTPCLVVGNHQSHWENIFMQLIIPIHSWVIKRELLKIPFFGFSLEALKPIAVDRADRISVAKILREGEKKIEDGFSMIMFPEATRVPVDVDVKFKPSAAKLAKNTNVPIVLMVHNSGLCWPRQLFFKSSGTIKVKIIEIIKPEFYAKKDVRELNHYMQETIIREKNKLIP